MGEDGSGRVKERDWGGRKRKGEYLRVGALGWDLLAGYWSGGLRL